MKNKKVLCTSLAAILLAMSLGVGATYALFTSSSKVDTVITTAKVSVKASTSNLKTYSGVWDEITQSNEYVEQSDLTFANGGGVNLIDDELIISKISPLDKVTFDIVLENLSDINILFRTLIKCEGSSNLLNALDVKIDGVTYKGKTKVSNWSNLSPNNDVDKVTVSIEMPENATSELGNLSSKITYSIEAIQANAKVENPDPNSVLIYNANDYLTFFDELNNGEDFQNKDIELLTDLDFENIDLPYNSESIFKGVFKGNNHTISNLKYEDYAVENVGLFPVLEGEIQDLNLNNVQFKAKSKVGALCGIAKQNSKISNCSILNSNIDARASDNSGGTYAGGLVGQTENNVEIKQSVVKNTKITAYNKFGGLVGELAGTLSDCELVDDKIIQDSLNGYEKSTLYDYYIGSIISGASFANLENNNCELYSLVTPENCVNVDFKQNERLYKFYGNFVGEKIEINSFKNLIQEYDGSNATFNTRNLKFNFSITHSFSDLITDETNVEERQFVDKIGQYKIHDFNVIDGSISLGAHNSYIDISNFKSSALDLDVSNCQVKIKDSEFKLEDGAVYRFDGNKKEYAFYMLAVNYDLIMENTVVYCQNKNALNFCSRGEWDFADYVNKNASNYISESKIKNSILINGCTITSVNGKALNIWGDHTYGSNYSLSSSATINDLPLVTKSLIKSFLENNTISVNDNSKYIQVGQLVLDKTTCEN